VKPLKGFKLPTVKRRLKAITGLSRGAVQTCRVCVSCVDEGEPCLIDHGGSHPQSPQDRLPLGSAESTSQKRQRRTVRLLAMDYQDSTARRLFSVT
jgi:hypothetical protein